MATPKAKLVGIRPSEKKDFLSGCNEPGTKWFSRDVGLFQRNICRICRNQTCIRAANAVTPWHHRMENQPEYLLNNPVFSDLTSPRHQDLASQIFDDLTVKATRLEIARINQDWEIPEGPTDGFERIVDKQATEDVEKAIQELKRSRGGEPTVPETAPEPTPEPTPETAPEQPRYFENSETDGIEYETQYPSSDGTKNYHIVLTFSGQWSCECEGFKYNSKCKHLETVAAWYESQNHEDPDPQPDPKPDPQPEPEPEPDPEPPPRPSRPVPTPTPPTYNTPIPSQGIMLDGTPGSAPSPSQLPPQTQDPWTPRKEVVVVPGARVVLKTKKP